MLNDKRILLIISGGIAAYKSLELIRLYKKAGASVRCILTNGGKHFVTPLSVAALTEEQVYDDLWSLKDETEMGHIRLSREADLIVVAPASANLIGQMAYGLAEDLASTTLLATNQDVMIAPAMNPMMWEHTATQENIQTLRTRRIFVISPQDGEMACGETGTGRMAEPQDILNATVGYFQNNKPLAGKTALVTSGPTHEPIDPVRFIGNRSSGKQGHAIASALSEMGANVTLVSGPVSLPDPSGLKTIHVKTAKEMKEACEQALPADIAIFAAAVCDWTIKKPATNKIKKDHSQSAPSFELEETTDILKTISNHKLRPELCIGFAAETENVIENAKAKIKKKSCDWIIANNVEKGAVFGSDQNAITIISKSTMKAIETADKSIIARDIVEEIIHYFEVNQKIITANNAEDKTTKPQSKKTAA
ncbi:MAG: bifunctional phosphopantothenoylcysteine decarboxylase/phosphopantothenate--cysteine ligase CoaBC [Pseudomonadota bacterium]